MVQLQTETILKQKKPNRLVQFHLIHVLVPSAHSYICLSGGFLANSIWLEVPTRLVCHIIIGALILEL